MNRGWADAWDELDAAARRWCPRANEVLLVRDGHKMYLEWADRGVDVRVWAEENEPRFGCAVTTRDEWRTATRFKMWDTGALAILLAAAVKAHQEAM